MFLFVVAYYLTYGNVIFCHVFYFYYRTKFNISQGVNAFDYDENLNLIGVCINMTHFKMKFYVLLFREIVPQ